MRLMLVGNYGVGNLGDEALRHYFVDAFPEVEWVIVSACPHRQFSHSAQGQSSTAKSRMVPRLPLGIRSFILTPWWRTVWAIARCNGLVFGGGSLFTDAESSFACLLWWWHAFIARLFRRPVILAFQGIGPFRTRIGEWCGRWAVSHSSFLSVRDEASLRRVHALDMNTKVVLSLDPVYKTFLQYKPTEKVTSSKKLFIIIPRMNSPRSLFDRACDLQRTQSYDEVQVLSMHPHHPLEARMCRELAELLRGTVHPVPSAQELCQAVARASLVLTQRYHGALAALVLDIPFKVLTQAADDKLSALQSNMNEKYSGLVDEGECELRKFLSSLKRPTDNVTN